MIIRILHIIIVLLFATTPLLCNAQAVSEKQQRERLEKYKRELANAKAVVDNLKMEKSSASRQVAALDREMKMRNEYIAEGETAFVPKGHPGNHFAALHVSKNLSELERLRLMVAKLEIENERLKKGYIVKGVGACKEFVTTKDLNSK